LQGQSTIFIKNRELAVYATITSTDVFSSHGDHNTLLKNFTDTQKAGQLKQVFLVHGEPTGMEALKKDMGAMAEHTYFPAKGDVFEL
jgi:metallo-beta-lactamase family protein